MSASPGPAVTEISFRLDGYEDATATVLQAHAASVLESARRASPFVTGHLRASLAALEFRAWQVYDGRPIAKARARLRYWRNDMRWRFAAAWRVLRTGDTGVNA